MKKRLIVGGSIIALFIALNLAFDIANKPKAVESTTIVAKNVEEFGKGWRVDGDFLLTKDFKEGFFSPNPEIGDKILIKTDNLDDIVGWKVKSK